MTPARMAGDDGPAFGSLANLGGPRKFKKKPVLVLDPEELEKAHMLFQEASAELLGEEIERPERPKSILGLAPIDDDEAAPEDMGESDDSEAGDDTDAIPSAEDVLRMTAGRTPVDPDLDIEDGMEDDFISRQLENLDVGHRIFPSLPLKSEAEIAAEEEAELARIAARANDAEPSADYLGDADLPSSSIEIAYDPERTPAPAPAPRRTMAFPVDPLPEPEAEIEQAAAPELPVAPIESGRARRAFGDAPFLDFPAGPLRYEEEPRQAVSEDRVAPPPADLDGESEPHADAEPPLALELDHEWEEDVPLGLAEEEHEVEPHDAANPVEDDSYTEIEDEPVDGYAFMYANSPRGRTLQALADGESNSLRAKLLKERADASAEAEAAERRPSISVRFANWLRGLFG
ncbi:hypothetical protein [Aurantiacibacter zhengii]|uniref:hypothetical protein n=1 Tax=Aurantiacibacter zhengii TaxID=2307003 RepID=UPI0011C22CA8|nr:hypothetical protein [Aurantiacibacter zhengii]